ncbi:MAG: hypothetical protein PUE81_09155 [Lachnospiraceae bacterium]|nr:hypothetical protein [Lachnospiraceae bacterium]MDD7334174.1 hypothetical protein [Lachnospiraceae bacterium]MDY3274486.1 hypothetical protein [Agathobacter sp.]MDY5102210.1 hypothetical protein [Agathobacter sp.]MDY5521352.1 hypothetical protein [Agathobacter sp.]
MKTRQSRQAVPWVRRYRCFLWILLLTLVLLAGGICYGLSDRTEIPKEGTLVHRGEFYERKA